MSGRYKDTDYAYISAKVRALETSLVTRAELDRMLAAGSSDEAFAVLRDKGFSFAGSGMNAALAEDILLGALKEGFDVMAKGLPNADVLKIFEYPYDCSNIKSAIKCELRGIDPTPLMFDTGSVPAKTTVDAVREREYGVFPTNMGKATAEAIVTYGRTKNPQLIDFILDKACFADIAAVAGSLSIPFITSLCRAKADTTDLLICLRVLRMRCGALGEKLVKEALVPGGNFSTDEFLSAYFRGEEAVVTLIGKEYPYISERIGAGDGLEKIERVCDDYRLYLAKEGKRITYGIEIPMAYLIALENEIQNIRIILAGKDGGLDNAKIAERLRDCYV